MSDTETKCPGPAYHRIIRDEFADLAGVTRTMPGDCYCITCHAPVPFDYDLLEEHAE